MRQIACSSVFFKDVVTCIQASVLIKLIMLSFYRLQLHFSRFEKFANHTVTPEQCEPITFSQRDLCFCLGNRLSAVDFPAVLNRLFC